MRYTDMLGDRTWSEWIRAYSVGHQNPVNRACHTVGIPMIAISVLLVPVALWRREAWVLVAGLFVLGWILQFVGHAFEGHPPEFFKDWRFLFVGLRWWFAKMAGSASAVGAPSASRTSERTQQLPPAPLERVRRLENRIVNYDGSIVATPQMLVRPETLEELQDILRSPQRFPSPVRAMGSFHSLTPCASSPGTMVDMSVFNKIVEIDPAKFRLTAQAGLQLVAAAKALRKENLQFVLNVEIGNITLGAAACCHTKDALDGVGYGQLSSFVTCIKWVNPSGELEEASEDKNRDLLYLVRSSHGLCGIIYEVTFTIKPLEIVKLMYLQHQLNDLTEDQVTSIIESNEAIICWTIGRSVVVQTRNRTSGLRCTWIGAQRRLTWSLTEAWVSRAIRRYTPGTVLQNLLEDLWFAMQRGITRFLAANGGMSIWNPDKIIDYERTPPSARYAFTFWAFRRDAWLSSLKAYAEFADRHFEKYGFRCNMPTGSYLIRHDPSAILSYSRDGDMMSIDPIHAYSDADKEAWEHFLREFNAWCHARNAYPLLNQTPFVERKHLLSSYGERWRQFGNWVRTVDPQGRMLNPFFEELLSEDSK